LAKIGRIKSVEPDGVPGDILKLGGEGMTPYLAIILEILFKNAAFPRDWEIATVFPIYAGGYRLALSNYRPISLTSVVCKQLEQVNRVFVESLG